MAMLNLSKEHAYLIGTQAEEHRKPRPRIQLPEVGFEGYMGAEKVVWGWGQENGGEGSEHMTLHGTQAQNVVASR